MSQADQCDLLCLDLPLAESIREKRASAAQLAKAAGSAKSLGDPTRLMAAAALRDGGELCVCDLAWVCDRSERLISHHARALRSAGVVGSRRDGKMVLYSLTLEGRLVLDAVLPLEAGVIE